MMEPDPVKFYIVVTIGGGLVTWLFKKLGDKWIDGISAKLDKIDLLETKHTLLEADVDNLGKKLDDHIVSTNTRLENIEDTGRRTLGMQKKILRAVTKNVRTSDT